MRDHTELAPNDMLCFNLYAASHAFTRFYQPLLAPLGLTYPQYLVMISLRHADGQRVGQLSADLQLETNTLSPMLKRLETAGHIRRTRCDADERRITVHLTDAGRDLAARAAQIPDCIVTCLGLPMDDIAGFSASLRKLRAVLAEQAPPVAAAQEGQCAHGPNGS